MNNANLDKKQRRARWYHLFIPLAALFLPVLLYRLGEPVHAIRQEGGAWVPDTGTYAGAEACRDCHADIVAEQLQSNHARTVRDLKREKPAAPFGTGQAVLDPLTGARYTMEQPKGGRPQIALAIGDARATQELAFEFGSGAHAHGYLAKVSDGNWIDVRLNYYQAIHAWDFTSSQDKPNAYLKTQPLGRPQGEPVAAQCFSCHSTVVRVQGSGPDLDGVRTRLRPDRSVLGISCESCHGPMADHVRERRAGAPASDRRRLSADEINQMCGRCHGLSNVNPAHPVISRFQPWGLERSRCFRESAGSLTCLTCHDPHGNAEHSQAFYEARCLSCHRKSSGGTARACPVNQRSGCVGCHMPTDSHSMLHMTLTDHRIRIDARSSERQAVQATPSREPAR